MRNINLLNISPLKWILLFFFCASFKTLFSQDTEFFNLYFEGNSFLVKKEYQRALEAYNKAINKFPKMDYVYYNRGNAKFALADYNGALMDYDQTITLNVKYADAYYQRAFVKFKLGNKVEGCEDMKKAKKLESSGADVALKQNCK